MNSNEKLAYLRSLPGETISPKELAMVAGGSPYSYNLSAKEGKLDLPHLWRGRNLRIWKGPVIRLIGGQDVQAFSDGGREEDESSDDGRRSGPAVSSELCHDDLRSVYWDSYRGCVVK